MRLSGTISKDGKFWIVEIAALEAFTQGRTKKEAYEMAADWVESMVNKAGFKAKIHIGRKGEFEVSSNDTMALIALMLKRKREAEGLSLMEVAGRLGASSKNAYARYEQGRSVPSIEKLNELLHAVSPNKDFVIQLSKAA